MVFWYQLGTNVQGEEIWKHFSHETMRYDVLSNASPTLLLAISSRALVKAGSNIVLTSDSFPQSTKGFYPLRKVLWRLIHCLQGSQHLAFRREIFFRKWPLVAVIAAVLTIVMASVCIEPAAVSKYGSCCQHNGGEQK
jgi:hypothetical protein